MGISLRFLHSGWSNMEHFKQSWNRPTELLALLKFKFATKHGEELPPLSKVRNDYEWLQVKLVQTSRSFAGVIREMHTELQLPIAVFYMVLRALDSVEDDMAVASDRKVELLNTFYRLFEDEPPASGYDLSGIGENAAEVELLENLHRLIAVHADLKPEYRSVIVDITRRMGQGMAEYLDREIVTEAEYDEYCVIVAGRVGEGLSLLFAASALEDPSYASPATIETSLACGLALQKTNITRDVFEDWEEGRVFWPVDIWGQYVPRLGDLFHPDNTPLARRALNHMILSRMQHVPATLEYMAGLVTPEVLRFVAIPQAMAVGTLAELYDNPAVFNSNVKLRKGLTACIFTSINTFADVCKWYLVFIDQFKSKIGSPSSDVERQLLSVLEGLEATCKLHVPDSSTLDYAIGAAWLASSAYLLHKTLKSHL